MAAPWDEKYEKAPAAPAKSAPPPEAAPAPAVAAPAPAVAASAPVVAPTPSTPAALWAARKNAGKTPVQVVKENMGEAGNAVVDAGKNATQEGEDFLTRHPELYLIPAAYAANKVAEKTGLYDTLANKIKGSSGPVPTTPGEALPLSPDPNNVWDIHNEPAMFANEQAPVNTKLQELQARAAMELPKPTPSSTPNSTATQAVADTVSNLIATEGAPVTNAAPAPEGIKAAWAPPTAEVINKPSMLPSGSTLAPISAPSTDISAAAATPKRRGPAPAEPVGNYPKKTTFKTAAEIPEGFVFRPDVGNLDRSMYNILGPEHRQQAKEFLTGGKMFGQSADVNADVSKLTNQYFQRLQSEIPETILGRDARKLQNVPSDFGVYGGKGGFGKAAKVAGVAGTLFAAADLANAAQKRDVGQALEVGAGFLPPFLQALTYAKGAGEGETAELDRQRRMQAYALQAGRGVAQGYDPRRLVGVAPPTR
jgi:hypothetical protein